MHVVWCFQLKAETVEWMQDWENAPPQLKLLEDFMAKAPNDIKFRSRWKMVNRQHFISTTRTLEVGRGRCIVNLQREDQKRLPKTQRCRKR